MSNVIVTKFGGSSLADATQIRKVVDIVRSDPRRRFVVVSAPGKRHGDDEKVTDMLIEYGRTQGLPRLRVELRLKLRFQTLLDDLGVALDLSLFFRTLYDAAARGNTDLVVSRGEYLCARIVADVLGFTFVDALAHIALDDRGRPNMALTTELLGELPEDRGYVIPGFYGFMPNLKVKTFSRGGSDLTGAIVAAAVGAKEYENWTDVSGLRMTDPRIVSTAKRIPEVTYKELRELTYMGATVLHEEVIFPLLGTDIPIRLRNTNEPSDPGTIIVGDEHVSKRLPGSIVGIAGKKDFTVIRIEKGLMNQEIGFIRRVAAVFEKHGVSIEHMPGGIDTLSVVVASDNIAGRRNAIAHDLQHECGPVRVFTHDNMALICVVGTAMAHTPGVAARVLQSVARSSVNVRMIDQGSSEISIIIGVENADFETAVHAIYHSFA